MVGQFGGQQTLVVLDFGAYEAARVVQHRAFDQTVDYQRAQTLAIAHDEGLCLGAQVAYEEESVIYRGQLVEQCVYAGLERRGVVGDDFVYYIMVAQCEAGHAFAESLIARGGCDGRGDEHISDPAKGTDHYHHRLVAPLGYFFEILDPNDAPH